MSRASKNYHATKRPFSMDYKTYDGEAGSPDQWRAAFNETMGHDVARAVLGSRSPYDVLGVSITASWAAIQTAYRSMAMQTHPDRAVQNGMTVEVATEKFKAVLAAFTLLKIRHAA